jgi:cation diffusion facilitator family transporter
MEQRTKIAKKVTVAGFFINLLLSAAKLVAGILGNSSAMVADAVHSVSDFATDVVVLTFVNVSGKESDESHHYGHGKFETFATLIISLVLVGVAAGILINGAKHILMALRGEPIAQPGIIAFWAAIVSIVSKELLFRYTIREGKKINSDVVIANGWHHRSDALSSLGTALGISGAIFLGDNWRILDPIAGVIVSIFIFKVAYQLAMPSIKELLESSLPSEVVEQIEEILTSHSDIQLYHHLRTRKIGNVYAIDVHIKLDRNITFVRSHDIASEIEVEIRSRFGKGTQIIIHTEPY